MTKFKLGDKVRILNYREYRTDRAGIPRILMKHGISTPFDDTGKVVAFFKEYVIVNYINTGHREMQLGFLESNLQLVDNPMKKLKERLLR